MITIVDYEAGNLTSVKRALDSLGLQNSITPNPEDLRHAKRIIFPGVGEAWSAMRVLRERGLDQALTEAFHLGIPIMGICLGSQIILSHSQERNTTCLGLIDGTCPRFELSDASLKVPHMGWNGISLKRDHPVLVGVAQRDEFYFVHSFYPQPHVQTHVVATCEYGTVFPAAIGSKNLFATQFHPEKSGRSGLRILSNFATWDGKEGAC